MFNPGGIQLKILKKHTKESEELVFNVVQLNKKLSFNQWIMRVLEDLDLRFLLVVSKINDILSRDSFSNYRMK